MQNLKIIGLDKKEQKIIIALKSGSSMRPIDIAKKTGIKRTTVNFLLKKLEARKIVKRTRVQNHIEWTMNDMDRIAESISNLSGFFGLMSSEGMINIPGNISMEIFKGGEQIYRVNTELLDIAKNKRIYFVQGAKSLFRSVKYYPLDHIDYIQSGYRKNKIILDGITGEGAMKLFDALPLEHLALYGDRLFVGHLVDDSLVDFDMDIFVVENLTILINYEKNLLIRIQNEEICKVFVSLMEALKRVGRRVDFNRIIKEKISKEIPNI